MTSALALLGGTPAVRHDAPHFVWPPLSRSTSEAVLGQLEAGISIYDRSGTVAALEQALEGYFGVGHAVLASSGTAALYDLYAGCRIHAACEIIVPAYTFFATVTPLLHLGATPVLADCDENGNLDPEDAAKKITEHTFAIVVSHMWGMPANMEGLCALAAEHDLILLEDGSHAHGATLDGRRIGTFGGGAAFSMNGPKPLSAGEGGFVLTDDDEIYYRTIMHGQYNKRCRAELPSGHQLRRYAVTGMGLKHRIHPLAAAIALEQLGHLEEYLKGREHIAGYMIEHLGGLPGILLRPPPASVRPSWYGLILQYRGEELGGLPVERFYEALKAEGCTELDRPGSTCPLNLLPLFQSPEPLFPSLTGKLAYAPGDFPRAEEFHHNSLKLPVWHREEDIHLVEQYVDAFHKVTENYHDLLG